MQYLRSGHRNSVISFDGNKFVIVEAHRQYCSIEAFIGEYAQTKFDEVLKSKEAGIKRDEQGRASSENKNYYLPCEEDDFNTVYESAIEGIGLNCKQVK